MLVVRMVKGSQWVFRTVPGFLFNYQHTDPVHQCDLTRVWRLDPVVRLGFKNVVSIEQLREHHPLLDMVDHNRRPRLPVSAVPATSCGSEVFMRFLKVALNTDMGHCSDWHMGKWLKCDLSRLSSCDLCCSCCHETGETRLGPLRVAVWTEAYEHKVLPHHH